MTLRFLSATAIIALLALAGCATSSTDNTSYAQEANAGPSAVSVPLN